MWCVGMRRQRLPQRRKGFLAAAISSCFGRITPSRSQLSAPPHPDLLSNLPVEILCQVVSCLELDAQRQLAATSKAIRQVVLSQAARIRLHAEHCIKTSVSNHSRNSTHSRSSPGTWSATQALLAAVGRAPGSSGVQLKLCGSQPSQTSYASLLTALGHCPAVEALELDSLVGGLPMHRPPLHWLQGYRLLGTFLSQRLRQKCASSTVRAAVALTHPLVLPLFLHLLCRQSRRGRKEPAQLLPPASPT
jgi:hypothetical protein